MQIYRIKTTSWEEEDLVLLTTLSEAQIEKVIAPIVYREREGGEFYDNDELLYALQQEYPNALAEQYPTELPIIII